MTAPLGGKIVEVTEENFKWVSKFPKVGGHRYPMSWLEDRMSHLKDGVPAPPQWKHVLEIHEQQQVTQAGEDDPEFGKAEGAYQEYILEKLGHIRYDCSGEEFGVHHEVRICGDIVKAPVMMLEIPEGTQDLSSEESLRERPQLRGGPRRPCSASRRSQIMSDIVAAGPGRSWAGEFA